MSFKISLKTNTGFILYFDNGPLILSEAQKHFMILNRMFTVYYARLDLSSQARLCTHSRNIILTNYPRSGPKTQILETPMSTYRQNCVG